MGPVCRLSVVFVVVFIVTTSVLCFNFEDRDPIVKRGEPRSYFGYSVALHKAWNNSDIRSSWLLVGAPLSQNLQPKTNKSGALFKCPIENFLHQMDCIQVPTDGRRSEDFEYEDVVEKAPDKSPRPPGTDEIKNNQWLGVNVRSQGPGGKVIVCAHRYIWSENLNLNQHGLGLCYSLTNDLEWEEQWEPCKGRAVLHEHQQFGYCQAGTSVALLSDGTALIGSPGPFTWRGTMFVLSIAGEFLSRNKDVYLGPLNDKPEPINKYSYLGMSVAAGKFFYQHSLSYAAGAPRSHDHGQVYIFNKRHSELEMNISLIIDGDQLASNFGYEILAADFNKDGFDDLLVSAPFYFSADRGGCVYIYYNLRNCTSQNCTSNATLHGGLETRFGFSLANLGDINRDGYIDLAVGAPYEGDGAIYIYLGSKDGIIETYSQKIQPQWGGIKTIGYSLSGGLDMDNNGYPDLLTGAYNSHAVILFRTRQIIDIVTEVTGKELKNIDTSYPGCEKNPDTSDKCFSFEACFTITSADTNTDNVIVKGNITELCKKGACRVQFDPTIERNYLVRSIMLEKNKVRYCHNETVYFPNGTKDILTPIKFRLNYTLGNNEPNSPILNQTSVRDFEATFKKDCGKDDICQSNLKMSAKLLLSETSEKEYVLYLGDVAEFNIEVNITNTGDPAYEAKLFVAFPYSVKFIDVLNKTRSCKSSKGNASIIFCDLANPLRPGMPLNLQLRFEISNTDNQTTIDIENELQFSVFVNSTSVELSNQTKSELTALVSRKAYLKLTGSDHTKAVFFSGEVKGESVMKTFDDVGSIVKHSYQIEQLGPMSYADLQVTILWPWQVGNNKPQGKWLLYLENVTIVGGGDKDRCYVDPPNAINLLNLKKVTVEEQGVDAANTSSSENVSNNSVVRTQDVTYDMASESLVTNSFNSLDNPNQDDSHLNSVVRRRRSADYVVPARTMPWGDGKEKRVVDMDCNSTSTKCIKIYCEFPRFTKGKLSSIQIKSRLWNSTFVEDYSKIDWIHIQSYANVTILDEVIERHNESVDSAKIVTVAYPDPSLLLETDVSIWIIVLAVIAGLVLLALLIFILWRVGFFKRNRIKDPTLSGNLTKQSEQETLLNK